MSENHKLTKFVVSAGWAAKLGPCDLKQTICNLDTEKNNILVGFETSDDAGVYQLDENQALVQTLDFITPVVDDPYIFGQIAAANSLSDVFAMGAKVLTALNIVGFDDKNLSREALGEILRGGNDKIKECGGVLLGGHTIKSPEMYYGLSATGTVHPKKVLRNNGAVAGDVLVLTKPLGIGVLTTAIKRDLLEPTLIDECAKIMASLNYLPSQIMRKYKVSACTDITGFGLLGHLLECVNEKVSFQIDHENVPYVEKTFEFIQKDVVPGGSKRNLEYIEQRVKFEQNIQKDYKIMLCDAQTSGGLLIAMNKEDAKEYIKEVSDLTFGYASIIGEVVPKEKDDIAIF